MRWLSQIRLETKLPKELKGRFYYELNKRSAERIKMVCWSGVVVFTLLLFIDYLRIQAGTFHTHVIYRALFWNHLIGVFLFFIPIYMFRVSKEKIRLGSWNAVPFMNTTLMVFILALVGQAVMTYMERESLVLYVIFVLITNWAISLNHIERLVFNLLSVIFIVYAVVLFNTSGTVHMFVHIYEAIGFTFLAFIFNTFDFNLRWQSFMRSVELAREKKRIEELEKIKSNLYTNLTHEFRTPLTVIKGMADLASNYASEKKWAELKHALEQIDTNSDNILNLINQLLSLSQLESRVMKLNLEQKDIVRFAKQSMELLEANALKKHIRLIFYSDRDEFFMDFDEEKLQAIITNLVSNGIKFNHEGGSVTLEIDTNNVNHILHISVSDSGYGIGKEHLPYIFDRFYQAETGPTRKTTGTGIGLALTRELVHLMNGSIDVSSHLGSGTTFNILLPITNDAPFAEIHILDHERKRELSKHGENDFTLEGQKPVLLIVEDNEAVRLYLAELLENNYVIELAEDGFVGLQKAKDIIPDLIISDVMMPGKSGFTLTNELKTHERTNHIPILLLTAKASVKDRMDGWERGADAYMTKPFQPAELNLRLKKLHETRSTLREKYKKLALSGDMKLLRKENAFLHKLNAIIEQNLNEKSFTIGRLSSLLFMSRMQLHRKLKALTGRSATNYIRAYRLYKARPLLTDSTFSIADVAFAVGFEDPGYFSKVFQKEFGARPSDFRKEVGVK